jgi:hypothetical protein
VAAMNQLIEQAKADMQPLLTPEQASILAGLLTNLNLEPGKSSFNFSF